MMHRPQLLFLLPTLLLVGLWSEVQPSQRARAESTALTWTHLSTESGDLAVPSGSRRQAAALILDINKDNLNDFVIASQRETGAAVVWYRRAANGWTKYLIDSTVLNIEAGGASHDIDADGDLDLVMGGDSLSNQVWWWENPYPNFAVNVGWTRRLIKNSGSAKHHDQLFGDFDGDGKAELVYWNQRGRKLYLAEIPAQPRTTQPWPATVIFSWTELPDLEGLAKADIDGDGKLDIVGGGRWFKHSGGTSYQPQLIDDAMRFTRAAVGQLKPGGRPEVVFGAGDTTGPLKWYEWNGTRWLAHSLMASNIDHGHSLAVADMNADGRLDIFAAEMRLDGGNSDAKMLIFLGDNQGNFQQTSVTTGIGNHESKVGDLDGDGDLDILGKPWNWSTPRLDIWLNNSQTSCAVGLDQWRRTVIDSARPWRAIFITTAAINSDQRPDILSGGWWYKNPGTAGGAWTRQTIGAPLNNLATVYDFDNDGDVDVIGTGGKGSTANATFAWARNAAGTFTILTNLAAGDGNFLQGAAVTRLKAGAPLEVLLSWHQAYKGLQAFTVPSTPSTTKWPWRLLSSISQGEALSAGDIDRDGDTDLLLGTKWLRNPGTATGTWQAYNIAATTAEPDRNQLVDLSGDGRLDGVVTYEAVSKAGKVAWYEQNSTVTANWAEHVVATVIGPHSLSVADMDRDGDQDLVVGEHNLAYPSKARLFVFENQDGKGLTWRQHIVYTGDEHHDGAQVADVDRDGDLDIVSIGWGHGRVLLYENTAAVCAALRTTEVSDVAITPTPSSLISNQPTDLAVTEGFSATFTVTATGATTPTYQWQRDGIDLPGAVGSSYTLPAVTPADDGAAFTVLVANETERVASNPAWLTVLPSDTLPTAEFSASSTAGEPPLTVTFDASASHSPNSVLTEYAWAFGDGATSTGVLTSHEYVTPGIYAASLTVRDGSGSTASAVLTITVGSLAEAPIVVEHPASVEAVEEDSVTFAVEVASNEPITYQWQRNGVDIPGETLPSYSISAVTLADDGARFQCIVTNSVGRTASNEARLSVLPDATAADFFQYLPLIRN
jgi:PKD repeat protein